MEVLNPLSHHELANVRLDLQSLLHVLQDHQLFRQLRLLVTQIV